VTDDELIDQALTGNPTAFGQLVSKYQDRLYTTVAHMLGSAEDARDVVQDAFVHAFVKLESFQRNSGFYTWMYRIAVNAAISKRRRQRPTLSVEQNRESTGQEPVGNSASPSDRMEQQERVQQVQAALATLSDEHRQILVLREIEGCDYDTIAEILDLPVGTVRSRLHRARLQLKEQLREVVQEDRP